MVCQSEATHQPFGATASVLENTSNLIPIVIGRFAYKSDLGNVDLPRTMPLSDSAADAGTLVPKNIVDHEGAEFVSKSSLMVKSFQKPGIMTGTSQLEGG